MLKHDQQGILVGVDRSCFHSRSPLSVFPAVKYEINYDLLAANIDATIISARERVTLAEPFGLDNFI